MKDWRSRVALGAVLAVVVGIVVMLIYGRYAGRLLDWRRAVSLRREEKYERVREERALARRVAAAAALGDTTAADTTPARAAVRPAAEDSAP